MNKIEKIILAAVARNNIIGSKGKIPWHLPEELKLFKETTMGFPLIMGRKTLDSIGKPLPGRLNIVVSKNPGYCSDEKNLEFCPSIEEAYNAASKTSLEKVFIIGGGEIFKQTIGDADLLYISHLKLSAEGDTQFPKVDTNHWNIITEKEYDNFKLVIYSRKKS